MALSTIASLAGSAAWTIAEWAGSAVVGELVSTGFSYLGNHKLPANGVAELKRIEAALPKIKDAMSIAEALKMKNRSFCQWVEKFRLAVEASEDVLDEFEYKKLEDMVKSRDEAGGSASSSEKRKSCTINDDTLDRLKEAITMLDEAAKDVDNLLQDANHEFGIQNLSEARQEARKDFRCETTSFLVERELFGREVEKQKIIDWLKRPTDARLSSFGIVGVGGLGKTTLVKYALQEMNGSNHFDKTIWVCVSTNFSVEDITRKILGELGKNNCNNKPLNALQVALKENVHLKKILLVLDDIWDDEKRSDWDQMFAPLRFVQEGSKILFTTRMESVANLLKNVISTKHESLSLQGLGEQELRSLFQSYAFCGFNLHNYGDLQEIGDQILKMLRGSPLAAKVIGCLLNTSMDRQHWRRVLNQGSLFNLEKAKNVVEVLKLSYYHLPANLQVCFRFCSIFPQDHQFDKDDLIRMWICSGFVQQQSSQEERPEDIGEDYFNLLLRKSFFEYVGEIWEGERRYVMHDLVHELAENVSYGECCRIERNYKSITIPSTVRHVYVHEHEMEKVSHLENIRSLVVTSDWNSFVLPNNLIKKSLRLLKISGSRNNEMPKEISYLVHLRYLSVEGTQPYYVIDETFKYLLLASVYKLYHLQVLEIPGYNEVAINSAIETTGVANLLRLRYMRLPKEIMQTIHEVHKLTSLQELTFFVGQESGQRINELGTLKNLRHLFIENIENIGDHTEAQSANLLGKNNLISLSLKWNSESNPIHPEKIIDNLQPPSSLMELTINNYSGERSPKWMEDSLPLNLSSLKLHNCPLWKNQLFSWNIPYLKILDIQDCLNLDKLPDMPLYLIEFQISNVGLTSLPALYQNSGNNTPAPLSLESSLRVVEIERCPNLISLHGFLQQDNLDLQSIEELTINNCERLVHLPTHGFGKLTSLKYLTLTNNPKLVAMDFQGYLLPTELQRIYMGNCGELDLLVLEASYGITTLTELDLQNAKIISITAAENSFRSLKTFNIMDCPNLIEFRTSLPLSLIEFRIINVGLISLPALYQNYGINTPAPLSQKSSLRVVEIKWCPNLISLHGFLQQDNLDLLAIEELTIDGCERLEHMPTHGFGKLTSLKSLKIENCQNLENRDCPTSLPLSLIEFRIINVGLISLPALYQNSGNNTPAPLSLKSSLRVVKIKRCPNLISLHGFLQQDNLDLQAIEKLTINGCERLEHMPTHGFGKLTSLKYLKLTDNPKLGAMGNYGELEISCGIKLNIRDCPNLIKFPIFLPLSQTEFCINNVGLSALPEYYQSSNSSSGPSTSSLKEVRIENCQNLRSLNGFLQQDNIDFESIEDIEVRDCENLIHLPMGAFGKFVSLQNLTISDCPMLKAVDNQSTLLPMALQNLTIENCGNVDEPLLESASSLPSLTDLRIVNCANISCIPSSENAFRSLNELFINECKKLIENSSREQAHGADRGSSLAALKIKKLHIDDLSLLLIEPLRSLSFVSDLDVRSCSWMEALPKRWFLQNNSTLKRLTLGGARNLNTLPDTMVRLTVLEDLRIDKADLLKELPELPASLRELYISGADLLEELPELPASLRELNISGADLLKELPELPASLRELYIWRASSLKSLPATMARLTALESLQISNCDLLEKLPELPASLTSLNIFGASSLKSLPATMARLTALESLHIGNADLLENLPELPASLRELAIFGASSLKSLPATMARLTALERLEIWNAVLLENLPELPASLRSLEIWGASSLKSLPATMARLTALESLKIRKAALLENLPELPASLEIKRIEGRGGRLL